MINYSNENKTYLQPPYKLRITFHLTFYVFFKYPEAITVGTVVFHAFDVR